LVQNRRAQLAARACVGQLHLDSMPSDPGDAQGQPLIDRTVPAGGLADPACRAPTSAPLRPPRAAPADWPSAARSGRRFSSITGRVQSPIAAVRAVARAYTPPVPADGARVFKKHGHGRIACRSKKLCGASSGRGALVRAGVRTSSVSALSGRGTTSRSRARTRSFWRIRARARRSCLIAGIRLHTARKKSGASCAATHGR